MVWFMKRKIWHPLATATYSGARITTMPNQQTETPSRSYFGTFSDPDAMALAIAGINSGSSPHPLGRAGKNFYATFERAAFNGLNIGIGRFAEGIPQTAAIPNVHTFMFATEPGIVRRVSGRKLFGQHIFHFRPNERTATSSPPGMAWAFGIVTMPFDQLAVHGPELTGVDNGVPVDDDRMFLVPKESLARLVSLMNDVSRAIREMPWIIEEPQPAKALSGTILDTLLACLTHSRATPDRAALGRHRQIVARFERAVESTPRRCCRWATSVQQSAWRSEPSTSLARNSSERARFNMPAIAASTGFTKGCWRPIRPPPW
jgi:hypothetical protein